jgi:hypothetical protein
MHLEGNARHNVPRIGRITVARGRDAADVALATSFGPHTLSRPKSVLEFCRCLRVFNYNEVV